MPTTQDKKIDKYYGIQRFAKTKEDFIHFYDNHLSGKVDEVEKEREIAVKSMRNKGILIIILLLSVFFINHFYPSVGNLTFVIWFVIAIYTFFKVVKNKEEIEVKLKQKVVQELVTFINPNFKYKPNEYIPKHDFVKSNIFKIQPNEYSGDDLIEGYVWDEDENEKTNLVFSKVDAIRTTTSTDSIGNTTEKSTTIFRGLFFKIDFNKEFGDSITTISPRSSKFQNSIVNFFGRMSSKNGSAFLEEVHLENLEFMNRFTVRASDQDNARIIIQTDFMEKVLEFINHKYEPLFDNTTPLQEPEYKPYFSFRDNKMYFLIDIDRNHFDIGMLSKLNIETIYEYFRYINRSLQLIDEINLNFNFKTNKKDVI